MTCTYFHKRIMKVLFWFCIFKYSGRKVDVGVAYFFWSFWVAVHQICCTLPDFVLEVLSSFSFEVDPPIPKICCIIIFFKKFDKFWVFCQVVVRFYRTFYLQNEHQSPKLNGVSLQITPWWFLLSLLNIHLLCSFSLNSHCFFVQFLWILQLFLKQIG